MKSHEHQIRAALVYELLLDEQWHATSEISSATVGGTEGTRRLREIRRALSNGWFIEKRKIKGSTQYEYRLQLARIVP